MRHTGAKTKREAVIVTSEELNRRRRLSRLAEELGSFEGFPSAEELHALRCGGLIPRAVPIDTSSSRR